MTAQKRKGLLVYVGMVIILSILSTQFSFTAEYINTELIEENQSVEGITYKMPVIRTNL